MATPLFRRAACAVQPWRTQENFDFDLTDPNLYTYPATLRYNSLYDKTLRGYFANPRVHKHLLRHGLVTRDGRVPCQLKEFNDFRQYLHRHNIRIIKTNHVRIDSQEVQKHTTIV